jgi:antitoxin Phd
MSARSPRSSRHHSLAGAPQVTASTAKNSFGRVLDRVAKEGRVAITKHDEPCAVLISIDEYRALVGVEAATLNTLADEFDALFDRMQKPGASAAMQRAFGLPAAALGRAALEQAAEAAPRRRAAAKVVRRGRG